MHLKTKEDFPYCEFLTINFHRTYRCLFNSNDNFLVVVISLLQTKMKLNLNENIRIKHENETFSEYKYDYLIFDNILMYKNITLYDSEPKN